MVHIIRAFLYLFTFYCIATMHKVLVDFRIKLLLSEKNNWSNCSSFNLLSSRMRMNPSKKWIIFLRLDPVVFL